MDEKYQIQLLIDSPLFDADWYKSQHPDIANIKLTPEQHYLRYGWRMGRSPSVLFCGESYQQSYPDVVQSNENPLVHYLRFGRREGREVQPLRHKTRMTQQDIAMDVRKVSPYEVLDDQLKLGDRVCTQLDETQRLLEKYVRRCHELEFQLMDEKL
ncbi:hypothetical protein [uncultured Microbulbifer sp.]|uniref:hypothetical protein n=1 Tax=uncultured Microbulbifer sp. TaxID=348147 RepID=UPI00261A15D9|nr:hypothetical protein [uncultured Microbulbifer sp.]